MAAEEVTNESPLSVGQFAGKWCSYNAPPDLPYDQREEDGGSLVFETDPLAERMELLGSPLAELDLASSKAVAMVAVRLSDVAPDGKATRVSYGLLNLTHHSGHDAPEALEPGRRYTVRVVLNAMAQAFPAGHRIRLSVSTSYWPLAWPPPEPVRLSVFTATSSLALPVRPPRPAADAALPPFAEPEGTPPMSVTQLEPGEQRWTVSRDLAHDESALEVVKDLGIVRFEDISLDVTRDAYERYSFVGDDMTSVRGETRWTIGFRRDGWKAVTTTRTVLRSTATDFVLHAQLDAYENDERVASRNWHTTIARDHV